MSGSSDDPLDDLIRSIRERDTRQPSERHDASGRKGLNPFDLLALPPDQRDLINWLSRRKSAGIAEMQSALDMDVEQLKLVLTALQDAGYILSEVVDDDVFYRVIFHS